MAGYSPSVRPGAIGLSPVALLGVPFDVVNLAEAVDRIAGMVASGRAHYVVTANVDFVVQARRDMELHRILLEADLVVCDGMPLVWASRELGNGLPERVAGSDLAPALLCRAAELGWRVFLLGAGPGVGAAAAEQVRAEHPGLGSVDHYSPPYAHLLAMDHEAIACRIRQARPDVLLVSFGCPKQEKWMAMHYRSLGVPVMVGVGATLDFLAGRKRRAPRWMARSGTEWVFRLALEPRRLARRYWNDLLWFGPEFARQWWHLRPGAHSREMLAVRRTFHRLRPWQRITLRGRLDAPALRRTHEFWAAAVREPCHWLLDLSGTNWVDSTGVGALLRWRKQLHDAGYRLVLVGPNAGVRTALAALRVDKLFPVAEDFVAARAQMDAVERSASPVTGEPLSTGRVCWQGEITAANAGEVCRLTEAQLATVCNPGQSFRIDLSAVEFMDSTGVRAMQAVRDAGRLREIPVEFAGLGPAVVNVLRLTCVDRELLDAAA